MPAAYSIGAGNTRPARSMSASLPISGIADTVYHFVMLTQAGAGIGPFTSMVNSLRRITPQEAAAIRPRVIDVVTVAPGDTVQSLAARMAYRDFRVDRFLSLNGLAAECAR